MMKKFYLFIIAFCIFSNISCMALSNVNFNASLQSTSKNENELIITLLTPNILNAIKDYYGEYRQFDIYDTKIEKIEKAKSGENVFTVQILVNTFEGPHNPPYGTDTITFTVTPSSIKLDEFKHRDEVTSIPTKE